MATTFTYATLQEALQDWLEEHTDDFEAVVDQVITQGEDRCLRDMNLKIFDVTDDAVGSMTQNVATLAYPSDALMFRSVAYTSGGRRYDLDRRSVEYIRDYNAPGSSGAPLYFSDFDETNLIVGPAPDSAYTWGGIYLKRPASIINDPNNWMANKAGDLLFHGCVMEAIKFIQDFEDFATWDGEYKRVLSSARSEFRHLIRDDFAPISAMPMPRGEK